jgi:hypothetical protein
MQTAASGVANPLQAEVVMGVPMLLPGTQWTHLADPHGHVITTPDMCQLIGTGLAVSKTMIFLHACLCSAESLSVVPVNMEQLADLVNLHRKLLDDRKRTEARFEPLR